MHVETGPIPDSFLKKVSQTVTNVIPPRPADLRDDDHVGPPPPSPPASVERPEPEAAERQGRQDQCWKESLLFSTSQRPSDLNQDRNRSGSPDVGIVVSIDDEDWPNAGCDHVWRRSRAVVD